MSEIPPYPPPPPLPPEPETSPAAAEPARAAPTPAYPSYPSAPPAPSAPPPDYAAPVSAYPAPYGYASAAQPRASRNLRTIIAAGILVVVLLLGIMGYVFAGYVYASSRISAAAGAINTLDSRRSYVNTTFDLLEQQASTLGTQSDGSVGKATATSMVTESQGLRSGLAGNDQGLVAARTHLNEQQWLTSLSQGRLTAEAARIDHGRKAIATVRAAAQQYVFYGHFLEDYYQADIDLTALIATATANDVAGAASADGSLEDDLTKALQSSANVAELPTELHDRLLDLQTFANDFGTLLNAYVKRDQAGYDAANKAIKADTAKLGAYDPAAPAAKIKSYYQHYRVDFNLEMDKATA
ncbi:MAG: hypothetical protein E6I58_11055 [Chloroflexi bacterium]|nr:MAG: hypothetical protein E6I58_11055 [Chloroflexota bacterium]